MPAWPAAARSGLQTACPFPSAASHRGGQEDRRFSWRQKPGLIIGCGVMSITLTITITTKYY